MSKKNMSNMYPDDSSLEEKKNQSLHLIKYFEKRSVFFFSLLVLKGRMDNKEEIKL